MNKLPHGATISDSGRGPAGRKKARKKFKKTVDKTWGMRYNEKARQGGGQGRKGSPGGRPGRPGTLETS